jgi:hypothetical protein
MEHSDEQKMPAATLRLTLLLWRAQEEGYSLSNEIPLLASSYAASAAAITVTT